MAGSIDDRRTVGISLKRFLGTVTVLETGENPVKTLFWYSHSPCRHIHHVLPSPGLGVFSEFCCYLDEVYAAEDARRPAANPGRSIFGEFCWYLDEVYAAEDAQRPAANPGMGIFDQFCCDLAVEGEPYAVVEPVEAPAIVISTSSADRSGSMAGSIDDRRTVGIPLKRFLGIATVLETDENPVKTLFWDSHRPCRHIHHAPSPGPSVFGEFCWYLDEVYASEDAQ